MTYLPPSSRFTKIIQDNRTDIIENGRPGEVVGGDSELTFDTLMAAEVALAAGDIPDGYVRITGHASAFEVLEGQWVVNPMLSSLGWDTRYLGVGPSGFVGLNGYTAETDDEGYLVLKTVTGASEFSPVYWSGSSFGFPGSLESLAEVVTGSLDAFTEGFCLGIVKNPLTPTDPQGIVARQYQTFVVAGKLTNMDGTISSIGGSNGFTYATQKMNTRLGFYKRTRDGSTSLGIISSAGARDGNSWLNGEGATSYTDIAIGDTVPRMYLLLAQQGDSGGAVETRVERIIVNPSFEMNNNSDF